MDLFYKLIKEFSKSRMKTYNFEGQSLRNIRKMR